MASKFQRKNSSFWWIKFRDENGVIRREATKWKIGMGLETRECARHVATLTVREQESHVSLRDEHRFSRWVPGFFETTYGNSPKTLDKYQGCWRVMEKFLVAHNLDSPIRVKRSDATLFLEWRTAQKIPGLKGKKTVCRNSALLDLTIFRVVMYEAMKRGYILTNPISKLRLKKDPAREKPELEEEDIARVREELKRRPEWMRVSFEIALYQGCRFSETCLPLDAVNFDDGTITFLIKGGRRHTTMLHPGLKPLFEGMKEKSQKMTFDMPARNSTRDWSRLFKKLKMESVSFHCTRVTAITKLARAGVNEQQAMAYIGHSHSEIHRIYQRLKARDLSACVDALSFAVSPEIPDARPTT